MAAKSQALANEPDEAGLIALALKNDGFAVRTIVRRYNQRLFRLARSVVRDDSEAEDVVQEAYIHAFRHLAEFRREARLSTWLSRIVLNEALGRVRRKRPTIEISMIDETGMTGQVVPFPNASAGIDPERGLAQRQVQTMLEQAVDDLPDEFRVVLMARVIEEMSIEETAELFALKPETVKTRLHRARRLLRTSLEEKLGGAITGSFPFDGWRCERMADRVAARLGLSA